MSLRWRILVDPPTTGPENMAVDHALAACSSPGEGVLRMYRWSRPTVSFGRNEPARERYDASLGRDAGIDFVRRPTGGRAVLHDRELTYSVVLPLAKRGGLKAKYRLINRGLVEALRSLGVPAAMADDRGRLDGLDSGPCFNGPAPGEVTVSGRKLVGSAQARIERAILQHGSLLLGPGQDRLLALESTSAGSGTDVRLVELNDGGRGEGPISLEEVLGQAPPWHHLVEAVVSGLSSVTGSDWHAGELTEPERARAIELTQRYSSVEWTWRR